MAGIGDFVNQLLTGAVGAIGNGASDVYNVMPDYMQNSLVGQGIKTISDPNTAVTKPESTNYARFNDPNYPNTLPTSQSWTDPFTGKKVIINPQVMAKANQQAYNTAMGVMGGTDMVNPAESGGITTGTNYAEAKASPVVKPPVLNPDAAASQADFEAGKFPVGSDEVFTPPANKPISPVTTEQPTINNPYYQPKPVNNINPYEVKPLSVGQKAASKVNMVSD
ncbi:MAG: hypothetical protein ACREQ5_17235, partial [Candidatus Dormibacteria bacterium]